MSFGLIFPVVLAIWLLLGNRDKTLKAWGLNRLFTFLLILGALMLSYINIPISDIHLNIGGVFILAFSFWLFLRLDTPQKLRTTASAILIFALIFIVHNGLLWQLDQYFGNSEILAIIIGMLIAMMSGGFKQALVATGLGVELAGLIGLILVGSGMGLAYLNIFSLITAGAWILLWIINYFRHRQLTNEQ